MALTQKEINKIAERWSTSNWEEHEKAFARQWMTQAQDDVAVLVEALREARDGAERLWRSISRTVDDIEGDEKSHVGK